MYQEKQQPGSMPNPYAQQGPANGQHVINQPGMTQQMGMRSGALDAGLQRDAEGKREWKHGLFGCFNACGNFCFSCWCPCMSYAENKSRLRHLEESNRPHPEGGKGCDSNCLVYCALGCCSLHWIMQIFSRGDVRERYGVRGNACTDCLASACCGPCELTQENLEIEEEERLLSGGS